MPHDQVQRLKAVLNYHPLSKSEDPEQRELYNFQKVLDQFLNDEDTLVVTRHLLELSFSSNILNEEAYLETKDQSFGQNLSITFDLQNSPPYSNH